MHIDEMFSWILDEIFSDFQASQLNSGNIADDIQEEIQLHVVNEEQLNVVEQVENDSDVSITG